MEGSSSARPDAIEPPRMTDPLPAGAPLTLFNSLSRSTETFAPIDPAMVRL